MPKLVIFAIFTVMLAAAAPTDATANAIACVNRGGWQHVAGTIIGPTNSGWATLDGSFIISPNRGLIAVAFCSQSEWVTNRWTMVRNTDNATNCDHSTNGCPLPGNGCWCKLLAYRHMAVLSSNWQQVPSAWDNCDAENGLCSGSSAYDDTSACNTNCPTACQTWINSTNGARPDPCILTLFRGRNREQCGDNASLALTFLSGA